VNGVAELSTTSGTSRHVNDSDAFGRSAPGSSPASVRIWNPLQIPSTSPPSAAKAEIDQLLSALGDSPCELFRDGDWREGEEAQNRLRQQYDALAGQGQIASAEDFIDRVATSNTDQVRCPGETPQPAATWFKHQLTQIRKQPVTDPNVYLEKK